MTDKMLNSGRVDFYTKVHKGLRAGLFRFSEGAGTADYTQPEALCALSQALDALLAQLSAHAGHEERFIHPLLAHKMDRMPFDAEHEALEGGQRGLARLMHEVRTAPEAQRRERGLVFYRALNVFIARYLEHLDAEERTMQILWERCSDEELAAVLAGFGASRPIEEALADMGWMLPALNAAEQAEVIGGMSAALARQR
jgi:hypothetical protein